MSLIKYFAAILVILAMSCGHQKVVEVVVCEQSPSPEVHPNLSREYQELGVDKNFLVKLATQKAKAISDSIMCADSTQTIDSVICTITVIDPNIFGPYQHIRLQVKVQDE